MVAFLSSTIDSFRAAELRCWGCQVLMEVKKERINRLLKCSRRFDAGSEWIWSRKKEKPTALVCCTCCHGTQPVSALLVYRAKFKHTQQWCRTRQIVAFALCLLRPPARRFIAREVLLLEPSRFSLRFRFRRRWGEKRHITKDLVFGDRSSSCSEVCLVLTLSSGAFTLFSPVW